MISLHFGSLSNQLEKYEDMGGKAYSTVAGLRSQITAQSPLGPARTIYQEAASVPRSTLMRQEGRRWAW